jgi:hypothetical protein
LHVLKRQETVVPEILPALAFALLIGAHVLAVIALHAEAWDHPDSGEMRFADPTGVPTFRFAAASWR